VKRTDYIEFELQDQTAIRGDGLPSGPRSGAWRLQLQQAYQVAEIQNALWSATPVTLAQIFTVFVE
jgi:hypothetical protein